MALAFKIGHGIILFRTLFVPCVATSCFNRTNARGRETLTYVGSGGLPLSPNSGFDRSGAAIEIPKPNSSDTNRSERHLSIVANRERPWQIGDPIVEPNQEVKTSDGRVFFVNLSPIIF
ncbi:hypothetical protein [Pleurocapsa sp. PCC 7327]|uniref:hypothetical protein n=1 Tax=Pleurocapsa sp. PCC 7327 TaxID=118163 RepID=UPI00059C9444|nr:hypothetical protein [Pleurocapsa sp. PCC 7327]